MQSNKFKRAKEIHPVRLNYLEEIKGQKREVYSIFLRELPTAGIGDTLFNVGTQDIYLVIDMEKIKEEATGIYDWLLILNKAEKSSLKGEIAKREDCVFEIIGIEEGVD